MLIIGDGKNIWTYDKDLKQVSVKAMPRNTSSIPALVLSGYDPGLPKHYYIRHADGGIRLDGKNKNLQFRRVHLWFRGNRLVRMDLRDRLGHRVKINCSNIKVNRNYSTSLFRFKRPAGVDLLRSKSR